MRAKHGYFTHAKLGKNNFSAFPTELGKKPWGVFPSTAGKARKLLLFPLRFGSDIEYLTKGQKHISDNTNCSAPPDSPRTY